MDKRVTDLIKEITVATKRRELRQLVVPYFREEGISKLSYRGHYSDGSLRDVTTEGFSEELVNYYLDRNLAQVNPIPHLSAQRIRPFRWSDAQNLKDLSPEKVEFLLAMRLAGIGDGLAMTVFGPNLRNAHVSLGFEYDDFDPSEEKILEFQLVAQSGHLRFCQLTDEAANRGSDLSDRESEVLDLIAAGKSNSVIATLMEISSHTVDAHLRRIYFKLGVNDRTSAALAGMRRGLLRDQLPR